MPSLGVTVSELEQAIAFARAHAEAGLEPRPFDPIYRHTLDQLAALDRLLASTGGIGDLASEEVDVGRMAARELGNDEREFAHALHVIQRAADAVTGDNARNHSC